MLLLVLIGIVLLAVVIALVSAYGGKTATVIEPMDNTQVSEPMPVFNEIEPPKAADWNDGVKTSVSKNFGKGGIPTGVSVDSGHVATANIDEDMERLKHARPFEPRATKLNLDEDFEEVGNST